MQIGKRRHRITLQARVKTQNTTGEKVPAYADYRTIWAKIETLTGRELENAKQVTSEVTHKVNIRYNSNVTVTNRVKFRDRVFDINAALDPDERKKQLDLYCKEAV